MRGAEPLPTPAHHTRFPFVCLSPKWGGTEQRSLPLSKKNKLQSWMPWALRSTHGCSWMTLVCVLEPGPPGQELEAISTLLEDPKSR